ncbi:MAG: hypothetical protein CMF72_10705 [Mameliella sp.]|nr:hypothetical protein [Mameliella sp.]|tara:strand:- start:3434 stop:3760 length:327 start_codon:yes stop_codon:yes gene_type:complete
MTVYLIGEVKVTDPAWIPDYAEKVHDIAAQHGGKYLSRSGKIDTVEGAPLDATIVALVEFPDRASLDAFASDPAYAPFAKARQAGSESRLYVIDDTDLGGGIPYLPAG